MSFFKALGNLLQAGAQTVALPLDIAKDLVTMAALRRMRSRQF